MSGITTGLAAFVVAWFRSMADRVKAEYQEAKTLQSGWQGQRAQANARTAVKLVIALTVGAIVAAFLLPIGIDEIVAVDTTSWGSGASSLWGILDLALVLAVFLYFINVAMNSA